VFAISGGTETAKYVEPENGGVAIGLGNGEGRVVGLVATPGVVKLSFARRLRARGDCEPGDGASDRQASRALIAP
jgi:hypothetical protein